MNVSGRRKPQAAGKLRAQVADDVAEKIAGYDDVELARVADDLHRQRVDIQVAGVDVRVFHANFFEHPLPEVVRKGHGIGFVAHADTLQALLAGVSERVADDALHALAGVHVLLNGNLVRRALLEEPPHAHIKAFGVLAEDQQANVFFRAIAQRRKPVVEQFDRSGVDVQVKLEAQPQQNVRSMLIRRHTRIPERAKENGVKLIAKQFYGAGRKGHALAEIPVGAPVEFDEFEQPLGLPGHRLDYFHGLRRHFFADAVTRYYRDARCGASTAHWNARQSLISSTSAMRVVQMSRLG